MPGFFARNIGNTGRVVRLILGLALIGLGVFLAVPWWARVMIFLAGLVGLFEAARGWCFMRACGIKMKF